MKRHFVRVVPVTIIFLLLGLIWAQDAPQPFKIDGHHHDRSNPGSIEETVKACREHNALVCVLTPFEALETMQEAVAAYPDVLIGYGSISMDDPLALEKIDRSNVDLIARRFPNLKIQMAHPGITPRK